MHFSIHDHQKTYETGDSIKDVLISITDQHDSFDFSGNRFFLDAFRKLMERLSKCKVKKLILNNSFATIPYEQLLNCLECFAQLDASYLEELDISDNAISAKIPPFFYDFLVECKNLKILKIHNCGLGAKGSKNLSDAIKAIEHKDNLEYVDIGKNKLDHGADHMCEALSHFKNLKTLKIQYNTIPRETMDKCLNHLQGLDLNHLDLTDNVVSIEGCKILGRMLRHMNTLYLGDCLIEDNGLDALISAFEDKKVEQPTKKDDLEDSTEVEELLVGAIHKLKVYEDEKRELDISYNDLTQSSINLLVDKLKPLNLSQLHIFGNDWDDIVDLVNKSKETETYIIDEEEDDSIAEYKRLDFLLEDYNYVDDL